MKIRNILLFILIVVWGVLIICENVDAFASYGLTDEELAMAYVEETYGEGNYEVFVCGFSDERQITFVVTNNGEFVGRVSMTRASLIDLY